MDKLFMLLIGATPPGRNIEQHDIFFGVGKELADLVPAVIDFWPDAVKGLHFDAWREVTSADGYRVSVVPAGQPPADESYSLFFLNLGGYKRGEFEEFHYKMIVVAKDKGEAVTMAKRTAFFRHTGFKGANAHIDDKYGVDVDDVHQINDILPPVFKQKFRVEVTPGQGQSEDEINLGYFKLSSFQKARL